MELLSSLMEVPRWRSFALLLLFAREAAAVLQPFEGNPNFQARMQATRQCSTGSWSAWSACDGSGLSGVPAGLATRTRAVSVVEKGTNGEACTAPLFDAELCLRTAGGQQTGIVGLYNSSDVNGSSSVAACTYAAWGLWSNCSVAQNALLAGSHSCGYAYQTRKRDVTSSPCKVAGAVQTAFQDCGLDENGAVVGCTGSVSDEGSLIETKLCNNNDCNVDCEVGQWLGWSSCSLTCGTGRKSRKRLVATTATGTGRVCPVLEEVINCNPQVCDTDCQVSYWSDWGKCSPIAEARVIGEMPTDCVQNQTRTILVQLSGTGNLCPPLNQAQNCNCSLSFDPHTSQSHGNLLGPLIALGALILVSAFCARQICLRRRGGSKRIPDISESDEEGLSQNLRYE